MSRTILVRESVPNWVSSARRYGLFRSFPARSRCFLPGPVFRGLPGSLFHHEFDVVLLPRLDRDPQPRGFIAAIAGMHVEHVMVMLQRKVLRIDHLHDDRVMPAGQRAIPIAKRRELKRAIPLYRATGDLTPGLGHEFHRSEGGSPSIRRLHVSPHRV